MKLHDQAVVKTTLNKDRRYRHRPIRELEIDIEKYQLLLNDPSLDAEQRADFLSALWSVILAFIDLGYGIHAVQQALDDFPIGEDMDRAIIRAVEAHWREAA